MTYIVVGIGIVAAIISFFNLSLAVKILVDVIILACFVAVLFSIRRK